MKTLKDVAGLYKTLAQSYMVNGPWKPAYKTGNLYRRIGEYNTAGRMIRKTGPKKVSLVLTFAPPEAEYGKFVEMGTYKMEARPFAEFAANDREFISAIDEFMSGELEQILTKSVKELETSFNKL